MDALKAQLLKIQQQLGALSASQKMLAASLVAIMLMTVIWWARYAGTSELAPVLDQSLPAAEIGRIRAALEGRGIEAHVVGDRVMVPSERRLEAIAMLTYDDALPNSGSNPWDEMAKQMGPFDPKSKTDAIQNHGKEMWLAQVIKAHFPGVANATVVIDPTNERRVTQSLEPKAFVAITTRGREANIKRLADAAAAAVSYAVAGLAKKNVAIVINGAPQHMQDANDPIGSGELYDQIRMLEQRNAEKIMGMMPAGTLVEVTVDLETSTHQLNIESYDKTRSIITEKTIKKSDQETQTPQAQGGEPGAVPNTANSPLAVGGAQTAGGSPNTNNTSEIEFTTLPGRTVEQVSKPAGKPTVSTAAVRLPRSYFVTKFKTANPNGKDPDEATLQTLFTQELPNVQNTVVKTVDLKSPDSLAVTMYDDSSVPVLASGDAAGGGSNMSAMVGGHAKELAVGALAVVSLFMVSMIVRKGTPAPIAPPTAEVKETPRLASDELVAGIVGEEGGTPLDGMELNEDTVKAQHMVEQVSTLVKENPDAAASLVKRWLNRS